ncbi:MAG: solR [Myxococcaceae bacterium]|nr:solR [Myxococcaceae bacterium]
MTEQHESWFLEVFEKLSQAADAEAAFCQMVNISEALGFRYCSYGIRLPVSMTTPLVAVLDSYPDAWMEHYTIKRYIRVDPTVLLGSRTTEPLVWSRSLFSSASALWEDAQAAGLRFGVAQASWGNAGAFGLCSLARDQEPIDDNALNRLRPKLHWLAESIHRRMQTFYTVPPDNEDPPALSRREHDVLCWTADGKTSWETAQILGISERTVNFHVQNVLTKLKAQNKIQAAVKATALGLLVSGVSYD